MRFKLDENMPGASKALLESLNHDVRTAIDQGLGGLDDAEVAAACRAERRALVTLDVDFADVTTYPPADFPGIVVLRLRSQDVPSVLEALHRFNDYLGREVLDGRLWIIESARIRVRGEP